MRAVMSGHRLTITGVGVFFGQQLQGRWEFTRHGRVEDPDQLGIIEMRGGKITLYAHGDTGKKIGIPLDHLRNLKKAVCKGGILRTFLRTKEAQVVLSA